MDPAAVPAALRCVYIQLRGAAGRIETLRERVARLGMIRQGGVAPETDAAGCWFEVALRPSLPNLAALRARLQDLGLPAAQVHSVRAVVPGEGAVQARQRALFGNEVL